MGCRYVVSLMLLCSLSSAFNNNRKASHPVTFLIFFDWVAKSEMGHTYGVLEEGFKRKAPE